MQIPFILNKNFIHYILMCLILKPYIFMIYKGMSVLYIYIYIYMCHSISVFYLLDLKILCHPGMAFLANHIINNLKLKQNSLPTFIRFIWNSSFTKFIYQLSSCFLWGLLEIIQFPNYTPLLQNNWSQPFLLGWLLI